MHACIHVLCVLCSLYVHRSTDVCTSRARPYTHSSSKQDTYDECCHVIERETVAAYGPALSKKPLASNRTRAAERGKERQTKREKQPRPFWVDLREERHSLDTRRTRPSRQRNPRSSSLLFSRLLPLAETRSRQSRRIVRGHGMRPHFPTRSYPPRSRRERFSLTGVPQRE